MGKSTISMAIFNSYVKLPEGNIQLYNDTELLCNLELPPSPLSETVIKYMVSARINSELDDSAP